MCFRAWFVAMEVRAAGARPFSTVLPAGTTGAQLGRGVTVCVRALPSSTSTSVSSAIPSYEEGELERPRYAGDDPVSRFVSSLIAIKPLFNVMKVAARQVLIGFGSHLAQFSSCSSLVDARVAELNIRWELHGD